VTDRQTITSVFHLPGRMPAAASEARAARHGRARVRIVSRLVDPAAQ